MNVLPAVSGSKNGVGLVDGGGVSTTIIHGGTGGSKNLMLEGGNQVGVVLDDSDILPAFTISSESDSSATIMVLSDTKNDTKNDSREL